MARRILREKTIRIFEDTPPITGTELDFLNSTYYRATLERGYAHGRVRRCPITFKPNYPKAVQDEFAGLELAVAVEPFAHPELVFFQIPLVPNFQWDALNIKVNGNIILQNLVLLQIPFEAHISVKGEVVAESPLGHPRWEL